jgi:hypothetical protein
MHMHITTHNRLASLGTVGLLFLAGIAGMVFLLPALPAHAGTATVSLSASSGTVGSFVTITGSGFTPGADVGIEFNTTIINTFGASSGYPTQASMLDTTGSALSGSPLGMTTCSTTSPCIETDANGWFKAVIAVPPTVNGAHTVTATDSVNKATTTFTTQASFWITTSSTAIIPLTSGMPDEVAGATIAVASGFGSADTVAVSAAAFGGVGGATTTPITSITTGAKVTTPTQYAAAGVSRSGVLYTATAPGLGSESLSGPNALVVSDVLGGKQTITATGTSSASATTTFTINPAIALFSSASTSSPTFSMGSTPTQALYLSGFGFTAGSIAANSITIGGAPIINPTITVGATGNFGVASGSEILLESTSAGLAVGPTSIGITVGTTTYTFSYSNGNIVNPMSTKDDSGTHAIPTTYSFPGGYTGSTGVALNGYGGPFIVSTNGITGSVATATLDSSSYMPNSGSYVTVFGYGFIPTSPVTVTFPVPTGGTALTFDSPAPNANGAFWSVGQSVLGEEPSGATPASGYAVSVAQASIGAVNQPTVVVTPWMSFTSSGVTSSETISFGTTPSVTFHGFTATKSCTLMAGIIPITFTTACTIGANGAETVTVGVLGGSAGAIDLSGGSHTLAGSDGVVTSTLTAFILPVSFAGGIGSSPATTLSVNTGSAATVTTLRTATSYGIHGLMASTLYTIVWDPTQGTQTTLGTFTSTATGGIPTPGVQVTVPAGASGDHIIGLETGGADIFFGALGASTVTPPGVETVNNPNIDASNNIESSLSTLSIPIIGQYGDDIFHMGSTLSVTPAVDTVGSTLSFTGSGLPVATGFDIGVSKAGTNNGGTSCALTGSGSSTPPTILLSSFTTTGIGSVPTSTAVPLTDMPTALGYEQGTPYCAFIETGINFGTIHDTAAASFILQASGSLNSSESPIGGNVLLTAHGLVSGETYKIIFAPYFLPNGFEGTTTSGTFVGTLTANAYGEGMGTLTVPGAIQTSTGIQSVSLGTGYQVELQEAGPSIATNNVALATPPSIVVGGTTGSCSNEGTTCMVLSGTPTVGKSGANTVISTSFTNNSNAPQTAYIYAVVHNALGQTVLYATSTLNGVAPGASETGQLVLFGLPSGTYTATVFVVSTTGTALSTSATVSVTI